MSTNTAKKINEALRSESNSYCIICLKPAEIIGVFEPNNPVEWGGERDKTRLIIYSLCPNCLNSFDTEIIETVIEQKLVNGGVYH